MTISRLLERIDDLTPDELDAVPYGMIQLDARGVILKYNAEESQLAQLPQREQIGRNFFQDVAPCTRVQEFYGRFREGVEQQELDATFRFHFAFEHRPRDVTVRLFYSKRTNTVWVIVSDVDDVPPPC
jgi:photoactive yellow protein